MAETECQSLHPSSISTKMINAEETMATKDAKEGSLKIAEMTEMGEEGVITAVTEIETTETQVQGNPVMEDEMEEITTTETTTEDD